MNITVQVLDGRNGKPLADQHVLVFTGLSADAVKTHAQHTGVTTGKDGMGTLTLLSEKSHQGVPSWESAPHQGIDERNCTALLGLQFRSSEIVSGTVVAPSNPNACSTANPNNLDYSTTNAQQHFSRTTLPEAKGRHSTWVIERQ